MPRVLRLLRPRQWTKNVLLFAALVFAEKLFVPEALVRACLAFVCFCLASSSGYVVNDLVDAPRDREHPEKRNRPIASGQVGRQPALLLAVGLTAGALALGAALGAPFLAAVLVYLALTHFYSFVGKNVAILDVMLVAAGFVIRAVAGALAIPVPWSDWFVLCTLFLALFIALSKRRAELLRAGEAASRARPVLAAYTPATLAAFTATSMAAALITYALYVHAVFEKYPWLGLTLPFVMFGLFRYQLLVETRGLGEKPEDVIFEDHAFQICLAGFAVVALAALYFG
jgi:4-hydroxybenzoate polyprenyltransferase